MSETLQEREVGKAVIVHPPTKRVLILQLNEAERMARSTKDKVFDEWHVPGGSLESQDEGSAEKAAVRETYEETGLVVRALGQIGTAAWDAFYEGDPAHFEARFFACVAGEDSPEPPEVRLSAESDDAVWIAIEQVPKYAESGLTREAVQFIPLALQEAARG